MKHREYQGSGWEKAASKTNRGCAKGLHLHF